MRFLKAAATSALLSLLFLVVYGGCNWITSMRTDVGTLCFWWERYIPFVPVMIVPYMSIDLFFVGAPFLCTSGRELETFAKRVTIAILVAGICFLLFPLRFAFPRPHAEGWLGVIFDWFRAKDQPYNLLPSLHIALRTFLADTYARHTKGLLRATSNIWFSLIGLSTLLTYQHHVMDVVGGFILAAYCFYFIRQESPRLAVLPNHRVGSYYLGAAIAALAMALIFRSWMYFMLWPSIACALVTFAYFGLGPSIFRKTDGKLPIVTLWALGPCLLGQYLSLLFYKRQCRPWDEIVPGVWVGRKLNAREAQQAVQQGVTAVLDLTGEFAEAKPFRVLRYLNLPILDLTAPSRGQLEQMSAFITEQSRTGVTYIHCKIGYSRSAAAAGAFLLYSGKAKTAPDAIAMLRRARPSIVVRPEIVAALEDFAASLKPGRE